MSTRKQRHCEAATGAAEAMVEMRPAPPSAPAATVQRPDVTQVETQAGHDGPGAQANPYGIGPRTARVMLHSAIESQARARHYRAWDDAPAGVKTAGLLLVGIVGGVLVGMLEAWAGYRIWPLLLGVAVLAAVLLATARWWIHSPLERVLSSLERAAGEQRAGTIEQLPLARGDEIGRLARIMHKVYSSAARDWHEARRLRRDLDHRVKKATEKATRQLRRMAMRDPLTEVGNRRFLEANLDALVDSAHASGTDLVCLAMDVDNFKQVNDTFGHPRGDELLIFLASLIRASIRGGDYVIRLGGDEFTILMPGADLRRASELAGQLLTLFRQHAHTVLGGKVRADLSIGIASLKRDGGDGQTLLSTADERLYEAKRQGKGRIVSAETALKI